MGFNFEKEWEKNMEAYSTLHDPSDEVLDDQIALMVETYHPEDWFTYYANTDAAETYRELATAKLRLAVVSAFRDETNSAALQEVGTAVLYFIRHSLEEVARDEIRRS